MGFDLVLETFSHEVSADPSEQARLPLLGVEPNGTLPGLATDPGTRFSAEHRRFRCAYIVPVQAGYREGLNDVQFYEFHLNRLQNVGNVDEQIQATGLKGWSMNSPNPKALAGPMPL